jgi:hypothetical protein
MKCFISFIWGAVALVCLQALSICGYGCWVQLAASFLFSAAVQIIADFKKTKEP